MGVVAHRPSWLSNKTISRSRWNDWKILFSLDYPLPREISWATQLSSKISRQRRKQVSDALRYYRGWLGIFCKASTTRLFSGSSWRKSTISWFSGPGCRKVGQPLAFCIFQLANPYYLLCAGKFWGCFSQAPTKSFVAHFDPWITCCFGIVLL